MKYSKYAPVALLLWGVVVAGFLMGAEAADRKWPPYRSVATTKAELVNLWRSARGRIDEPYVKTGQRRTVVIHRRDAMAPGMTMISGVGPAGSLFVKLVDAEGQALHAWDIDWFRLWPDARHVPDNLKPKQRPGTGIHGMLLSANGDLTFNFDGLGLMQLDICGRPKWRLPRLTSHSLYRDAAGDFWTFDFVERKQPLPDRPNLGPPFFEFTVLKVSPQGRVLREIPVTDLLLRNGYQGMLYESAVSGDTRMNGDTLHLNSVELFPANLKSGLFKAGDVMMSFRNTNSIVVFDPGTLKVRKVIFGPFVRQHDPHFVDGSTITVFDNNNVGAGAPRASSRVVAYSVSDGTSKVLFEGTPAHPFYTYSLGKQYTLANGDLLLTEAQSGRVLEVSPGGEVVWEYFNHVKPGILAQVSDAQRITPAYMSADRLKALAANCPRKAGV
jgi:hypothetical protein